MKFPLFERVALTTGFPAHGMVAGDVVTTVEFMESPADCLPNGYCVEAFNAVGDTIAVFVVQEDNLQTLTAHDVLSKQTLELV